MRVTFIILATATALISTSKLMQCKYEIEIHVKRQVQEIHSAEASYARNFDLNKNGMETLRNKPERLTNQSSASK